MLDDKKIKLKTFNIVKTENFHNEKSNLEKEHPELADLYKTLNIYIKRNSECRSRDLQRLSEIEIHHLRKKIRDYEKKNNIKREDHKRWNS